MDAIRDYLLRIISAALLCGIATGLVGKKSSLGAVIKLLTGVFMIFTVVSPAVSVRIQDFSNYLENLSSDSSKIVAEGETMAGNTLAGIIKDKTEAYILDKAQLYGAELSVEVSVDCSGYPVPCAVIISGNISPYGRSQLEMLIANNLGIEVEEQTWTG